MPPLPPAILFDLDETILSFGQRKVLLHEVAATFAEALAPVSVDEAAEVLEAHSRAFWSDGERHRLWRQRPLSESRRYIASQAFAELTGRGARGLSDELAAEFGDRFHAHREAQIRFFPGALETLDALKARGVRMALVTNGVSEVQRGKIDRFDLARRFEHIQIEGEHGFGKPELQAYRHAMDVLGVEAHQTWMVGDNLEWEVAAPQKLGIHAIWHDPFRVGLPEGSAVRPDRIIHELGELREGV